MNKSIINGIVLSSLVLSMAACDENSWNDKMLDGFDGEAPITDVQTVEYTLTASDYSAIASNSTNKALAGEAYANALKALGTNQYFTDEITAAAYVPAFLASNSFSYYTLSNGSSIKLTYNKMVGLPAEVANLAAASKYTLNTYDYMQVWSSEDDFINGFAPSHLASKYLPAILLDNLDDAQSGDYAVVTYYQTEQEPVFGTQEQPAATFDYAKVTTISAGVYLLVADGCAASTVEESKSYGYLQKTDVEENGSTLSFAEEPVVNEFQFVSVAGGYNIIDCYGRYMYMKGDYNSFNFGTTIPDDAFGVWSVEINDDDEAVITNVGKEKSIQYDANYSSFGAYPDVRGLFPTAYAKVQSASKAPLAEVPMTAVNSVWKFSGSSWSMPSDVVVLQPSDYKDMGQKYENLSNNGPALYLPSYLKGKYPYAQADDQKYVMYQYYNGSATAYRCDLYVFDGNDWTAENGIETETSQFVRSSGEWKYDPSVTVTLPAGKGQPLSTIYYQACVDWVYNNIDKPLGATSITSGMFYVTSYGNNEYYSGTSAYQGNVDLRPSAAIQQYPAGYEGMSNDEIVELMKHRFAYEVMPGALKSLHPDARPVEGVDVLYTINFGVYTGANASYTIVYKVVGPAEFEFVECDWWENGHGNAQ